MDCVCVCVCRRAGVRAGAAVGMRARTHACTLARMHACTHARPPARTHACVRAYLLHLSASGDGPKSPFGACKCVHAVRCRTHSRPLPKRHASPSMESSPLTRSSVAAALPRLPRILPLSQDVSTSSPPRWRPQMGAWARRMLPTTAASPTDGRRLSEKQGTVALTLVWHACGIAPLRLFPRPALVAAMLVFR